MVRRMTPRLSLLEVLESLEWHGGHGGHGGRPGKDQKEPRCTYCTAPAARHRNDGYRLANLSPFAPRLLHRKGLSQTPEKSEAARNGTAAPGLQIRALSRRLQSFCSALSRTAQSLPPP